MRVIELDADEVTFAILEHVRRTRKTPALEAMFTFGSDSLGRTTVSVSLPHGTPEPTDRPPLPRSKAPLCNACNDCGIVVSLCHGADATYIEHSNPKRPMRSGGLTGVPLRFELCSCIRGAL